MFRFFVTIRVYGENRKVARWIPSGVLAAVLAVSGCGDDSSHNHHHECEPECTGGEICQHGNVCGMPCTDAVSPTICETYISGEVHYCHPESGMCEPFGESCSPTDVANCADFQICQVYVEAGTCAIPCDEVGGDAFCQMLDAAYVCHEDAAGGVCAPTCTDAGGTVDCGQLPPSEPGDTLSCNSTSGVCEGS